MRIRISFFPNMRSQMREKARPMVPTRRDRVARATYRERGNGRARVRGDGRATGDVRGRYEGTRAGREAILEAGTAFPGHSIFFIAPRARPALGFCAPRRSRTSA